MLEKTVTYITTKGEVIKDATVIAESRVAITVKKNDIELLCGHGSLSPADKSDRNLTREELIIKWGFDVDGTLEKVIQYTADRETLLEEEIEAILNEANEDPSKSVLGAYGPSCGFYM